MRWRRTMDGDMRTRTVFAFLPIWAKDGTVYWLERVTIRERFLACMEHRTWMLEDVVTDGATAKGEQDE